jgi:hypothetical protein
MSVLELDALLVVSRSHPESNFEIAAYTACRISRDAVDCVRQHFCANLSKVSNFSVEVKLNEP